MTPSSASPHLADGRFPHTVKGCELSLCSLFLGQYRSNYGDVRLRQARVAILAASRCQFRPSENGSLFPLAGSPLQRCITHVVSVCAEPQVVGSYAISYIAGVADKQPIRNRAIGKFVGVAMSGPAESFAVPLLHEQSAVAGFEPISRPKPARLSFVNVIPEPFLNGSPWSSHEQAASEVEMGADATRSETAMYEDTGSLYLKQSEQRQHSYCSAFNGGWLRRVKE